MKRAFIEMLGLISMFSLLAIVANQVSPRGIPLFGKWDVSQGIVNAGGRCQPHSPEINDADLDLAYLNANVLLIDARSRELYREGHIPGALSYPLGEFQALRDEFLALFPSDKPIIIYCIGLDCHDSHDLLKMLENSGYTDLKVYSPGFDGWVARNRPVRTGDEP